MGENSKIAWTHHTFNPWVGCQRVSPGCENCYAEAYDKRVEPPSLFEVELTDPAGADLAEWPEDLRVREFPR